MKSKNKPSQNMAGSHRLQLKILLATSIMLKEIESRKREAILTFLNGMIDLDEAEQKLFDERMAEFKGILEMPNEP